MIWQQSPEKISSLVDLFEVQDRAEAVRCDKTSSKPLPKGKKHY